MKKVVIVMVIALAILAMCTDRQEAPATTTTYLSIPTSTPIAEENNQPFDWGHFGNQLGTILIGLVVVVGIILIAGRFGIRPF